MPLISSLLLLAALEQPMAPPGGLPGAEPSASGPTVSAPGASGERNGGDKGMDKQGAAAPGWLPIERLRADGFDPEMVEVIDDGRATGEGAAGKGATGKGATGKGSAGKEATSNEAVGSALAGDALIGARRFTPVRVPGGAGSCVHLHLFRVPADDRTRLIEAGVVAIDYEVVYRASFGGSPASQSAALDHERIETTLVVDESPTTSATSATSGAARRPPDLRREARALRHWQTFRLGRRTYAAPLETLPAPPALQLIWDGHRYVPNPVIAAALAPGCE